MPPNVYRKNDYATDCRSLMAPVTDIPIIFTQMTLPD
jgi:hypothetical protein